MIAISAVGYAGFKIKRRFFLAVAHEEVQLSVF